MPKDKISSKKNTTSKNKVSKKKITKKKTTTKKTATRKVATKKAVKKTATSKKPISAKPTPADRTSEKDVAPAERENMIAVAAYYRWEQSGCCIELEIDHWLLAEQDIDELMK